MSTHDIDALLSEALGSNQQATGIDPAGITTRINQCQPETQRIIKSYLDRTMRFPLPRNSESLSDVYDEVFRWLETEMPELTDVTRRKLSNYYAYEWR